MDKDQCKHFWSHFCQSRLLFSLQVPENCAVLAVFVMLFHCVCWFVSLFLSLNQTVSRRGIRTSVHYYNIINVSLRTPVHYYYILSMCPILTSHSMLPQKLKNAMAKKFNYYTSNKKSYDRGWGSNFEPHPLSMLFRPKG